MLPMVPIALAFVGVGEPDGIFARVWSLLPFSAFAGMPVRMSLAPVAGWEIAVAMLGTGLSAAALRRLAGKIFAVGMLMHGKEPSWREVVRWMKQA